MQLTVPESVEELLALDEALEKLAARAPVKAELVKLRYFAGMAIEEAPAALGTSSATAKRYGTYHARGSTRRSRGTGGRSGATGVNGGRKKSRSARDPIRSWISHYQVAALGLSLE